ncbi:MAG: hypothetical protein GY822_23405 [Deltaproteobacteria bacterium]|nr:hypothetical protein [Deltaproteobacteria bacterium]
MAISAFVFSNPSLAQEIEATQWQERLLAASKRIIRRGSDIDPDQEPSEY